MPSRPKEPRPAQAPRRTVDADGVVRIDRPRSRGGLLAGAAVIVVGIGLAGLFFAVRGDGAAPAPRGAKPVAADPSQASGPVVRRPIRYAPSAAASAEEEAASEAVGDGQEREVYLNQIDRTGVEKTGIHAFNLPGTKPIQGGLIVPEGYVLPPGYVRHHQTTDDGEPVPPILKFHPDHKPVDAAGNPIPLPADGIVTPDLAPPDMPLQALEPPPVRRDFDRTSSPAP